jgi:hypothetical protein
MAPGCDVVAVEERRKAVVFQAHDKFVRKLG